MYAIRARRKTVTEKHFLDAVNKVIKGYQKFSATPKYMGMTLEEYQKPKGMNSNAREQVAGTGMVNEGEKTVVSDKSFNVEDSNDEKKKNAVNESEEKELEDKLKLYASRVLSKLGSDLTGGCMNPAAAVGWAYALGVHKTKEHIVVYWFAPIEATLLAVWTFRLLVRQPKPEKQKKQKTN
ncbi:putative aquaporin [Helianthus annuus]|nr:putative aquaporin [Helianthus annuus]